MFQIRFKFAFLAARAEVARMNKLNGLILSLSAAGAMGNTVWAETFMCPGKMNCSEGVLTPRDDCLEWMGAAKPVDEADSERCEQMTNFTSHYLLIIQPFAI